MCYDKSFPAYQMKISAPPAALKSIDTRNCNSGPKRPLIFGELTPQSSHSSDPFLMKPWNPPVCHVPMNMQSSLFDMRTDFPVQLI